MKIPLLNSDYGANILAVLGPFNKDPHITEGVVVGTPFSINYLNLDSSNMT